MQGAGRPRTFQTLRAREEEYFGQANGYLTPFRDQCGIAYLSDKLRVVLGREIERRLPGVHDQLKVRHAVGERATSSTHGYQPSATSRPTLWSVLPCVPADSYGSRGQGTTSYPGPAGDW